MHVLLKANLKIPQIVSRSHTSWGQRHILKAPTKHPLEGGQDDTQSRDHAREQKSKN